MSLARVLQWALQQEGLRRLILTPFSHQSPTTQALTPKAPDENATVDNALAKPEARAVENATANPKMGRLPNVDALPEPASNLAGCNGSKGTSAKRDGLEAVASGTVKRSKTSHSSVLADLGSPGFGQAIVQEGANPQVDWTAAIGQDNEQVSTTSGRSSGDTQAAAVADSTTPLKKPASFIEAPTGVSPTVARDAFKESDRATQFSSHQGYRDHTARVAAIEGTPYHEPACMEASPQSEHTDRDNHVAHEGSPAHGPRDENNPANPPHEEAGHPARPSSA